MKKIFVILLLAISLIAQAQTSTVVNIIARPNTIGSAAVVNVFLNDELAGRVTEMENLHCKLFSNGRITITITYPEAYIRKSSNVDIEKGKTYYFFITSGYSILKGTEEQFKELNTELGKTWSLKKTAIVRWLKEPTPMMKAPNKEQAFW